MSDALKARKEHQHWKANFRYLYVTREPLWKPEPGRKTQFEEKFSWNTDNINCLCHMWETDEISKYPVSSDESIPETTLAVV